MQQTYQCQLHGNHLQMSEPVNQKSDISSSDYSFMSEFSDDEEENDFLNDNQIFDELQKKLKISSTKRGSANLLQTLVSKQKRRFTTDGFDLDLTYITENIIAMGYPSESVESLYRNSLSEVQRFFNTRHPGAYKLYNLCSEKKYKHSHFEGRVCEFDIDDHNPPEDFLLIHRFCQDVEQWLNQDTKNIAAIHCKAGKGRTGFMICAYLLYNQLFKTAKDSLRYYGLIRTKNKKGVTIPSQIRYVYYYERFLHNNLNFDNYKEDVLEITSLKLNIVPNVNLMGGCEPWFTIKNKYILENKNTFNSKTVHPLKLYKQNEPYIEFKLDVQVQGNFNVVFYNSSMINSKEKMLGFWLNTAFIDQNMITIEKNMIDKCCKDKHHKTYNKNFQIEIQFNKINTNIPHETQIYKKPTDRFLI